MKTNKIKLFHVSVMLVTIVLFSCDSFGPERKSAIYFDEAFEAEKQQKYEMAKGMYLRAIEETKKEGLPVQIGCSHIYNSLSQIYMEQGKYDQALDAVRSRYRLGKSVMRVYELSRYYIHIGDIYIAQGKYDCVMGNLEQGLKFAIEEEKKEPGFTVINVNPSLANYYMNLGDYEKARQYRQETLNYFVQNGLLRADFDGRAKNELAQIYYYAGDEQASEKLIREAGGANASAFVTFPEDLVKSLTILGRIKEHRGAWDKALGAYQSARSALHMYRTVIYKVEEADVLNLIGRFYLKQNNPGESAKAYNEAIQLRTDTATQTHPNCADAHKGLADVAAYENDLTSATLEAAQALKILDTALVPTHPRIAPTLIALSSIDILAGHPEQAAPLLTRIETIRQKPLGPWKEDFMDTAAFYAGLLKKAGKIEAAARLEQLAARQKDRR